MFRVFIRTMATLMVLTSLWHLGILVRLIPITKWTVGIPFIVAPFLLMFAGFVFWSGEITDNTSDKE